MQGLNSTACNLNDDGICRSCNLKLLTCFPISSSGSGVSFGDPKSLICEQIRLPGIKISTFPSVRRSLCVCVGWLVGAKTLSDASKGRVQNIFI